MLAGGRPTSVGRFQGCGGPGGADATGAADGQERVLPAPPLALLDHGGEGERK